MLRLMRIWLSLFLILQLVACSGSGETSPATGGATGSGGLGSGGDMGSGAAPGSGGQVGTSSGGTTGTGGESTASGGAPSGSGGLGSGGMDTTGSGGDSGEDEHWVGTWATANQITEQNNLPPTSLANNTLRQIVRVSIGGSELRVRISNEYGTSPVTLKAVHIANSTTGVNMPSAGTIEAASDTALSFNGMEGVTIPAGEYVASDPFDFDLMPLSKVALTIAFGAQTGDVTGHPGSRTTSFIQSGNQVSAASVAGSTTDHWYFISGIDVMAPADTHAIAILGDSITDGRGSTTNGNDRWPDRLAERLQANEATKDVAVLNLGIGGNRVIENGLGPTALERLDTQIIDQPGVKWVMVLEGVNDIGEDASAEGLITALGSIVEDVKQAGLTIYGIPILPFAGSSYDSTAHQQVRTTVNDWIRMDGNFDEYIPMDEALTNGANPPGLPASYQNDNLHPLPEGYKTMADSVDLALFQ